MPVPAVIASAAENYRFNSDFLAKMVSDLSPEEWLNRPNEKTNHITWIVGHLIWTRKQLLGRMGAEWSHPLAVLLAASSAATERRIPPPMPSSMPGARSQVCWPARWEHLRGGFVAALQKRSAERRWEGQRRSELPRHPRDLPCWPGIVSARLAGSQGIDGIISRLTGMWRSARTRPNIAMRGESS